MNLLYINLSDLKTTLNQLSDGEFKEFIDRYDEESSKSAEHRANVIVAHDTRASCALLLDAFTCGVQDLNGVLTNYGLLTTPQLHYMVRCKNTNGAYGQPDEDGYYKKLSKAFNNIWSLIDFKSSEKYENDLYVDGANGIGADKMKIFREIIRSEYVLKNNNNIQKNNDNQLNITIFNDGKAADDTLNHLVSIILLSVIYI